MDALWEALEAAECERLLLFSDRSSGLRAVLAIDDVTLGPAAGGIRTRAYPDTLAAARDAIALARAMTLKCSIAGIDAGGGKMVVLDHRDLDRGPAFRALGDRVEELGGLFVTAGDAGTRRQDLEAMAERTGYVHVDHGDLSGAVADGMLGCITACAEAREREVAGLIIAIQGCGAIGAAVARKLGQAGAQLIVADIDAGAAAAVAASTGAAIATPDEILTVEADILAPCALGGVISAEVVPHLRAWAICGAANNILASAGAGTDLVERAIIFVPDFIASAGAVIQGICAERDEIDRAPALIAGLHTTAARVLRRAAEAGAATTPVAVDLARERIRQARH